MELTTKNIEQLYKFTKDHFVDWYDLQTELVDHLANDIEEIWKKTLRFHLKQQEIFHSKNSEFLGLVIL